MVLKSEGLMKSFKLLRSFKGGDGIQNLSLLSSSSSESGPTDSESDPAMMPGGMMSAAQAAMLVAEGYCSGADSGNHDLDAQSNARASTNGGDSDDGDSDDDTGSIKDLDDSMGSRKHVISSGALLAQLGPSPTADEIANLAANRAQEYIVECFDDDSCTLDKEKFEAIPQYVKSDLVIGKLLGKGSFSDAFEVTLTVKKKRPKTAIAFDADNGGDGGQDMFALAASRFGTNGAAAGVEEALKPTTISNGRNGSIQPNKRAPRRASSAHLSKSMCLGNMHTGDMTEKTLVMKCLRPQICASAEQFLVGVQDLVRETAILASLDHPNIIRIHGRSGDSVSDSFRLSDGYFILLDRLTDTLEHRINHWKKTQPASKKGPSANQLRVASSLADAILFLHRNQIVFRDLKPANVGFNDCGVLTLFDFGFAVTVEKDNPTPCLEKCGTLRYMAPEVGLGTGYGMEADIFSVGVLLWEICALKKPFSKIKSASEFEMVVFKKDTRPKLGKKWPQALKKLISECWSKDPSERPAMSVVKSILAALAEESSRMPVGASSFSKSIRSTITRRVTWD